MSPEFNALALTLVVILFLLWNLDFVATLLTLKNLKPALPGEFADVWDEEKYAKSQQYERTQARFAIISSLYSLTLLLVFWFIGGFAWVDTLARTLGMKTLPTGLLFFSLMYLGHWLLTLPLDLYHTFVLEEKFGFNKTTPGTFISDQIKGHLLAAILGLPILALVLWIFMNVAQAWLWAWLAVTCFSLLLTYLAPSLILPLFNKFTPMPDGELKSAIHAMAEKCEFPLTEISIMDGSKRTGKANAFFTGFGKHKKIALYDNLIEGQSTEELVGVLAHEIGHFKKKHIIQRLVLSVLQTGLMFYLLGLATDPFSAFGEQLYAAFGIPPESAPVYVGFVLFMILYKPVSRLLSILMNLSSRKHEFEADEYAARAQETPEHLISALKKLSADNLSNLTPHSLEVFLDHSHPPVLERIEAMRKLGL
ncbi:MAG: M48 family metallopeptidase [Verrucomicrobiales bacterium]